MSYKLLKRRKHYRVIRLTLFPHSSLQLPPFQIDYFSKKVTVIQNKICCFVLQPNEMDLHCTVIQANLKLINSPSKEKSIAQTALLIILNVNGKVLKKKNQLQHL